MAHQRSAAHIADAVKRLQALRRPVKELTCVPQAIHPAFFSDWIPEIRCGTMRFCLGMLRHAAHEHVPASSAVHVRVRACVLIASPPDWPIRDSEATSAEMVEAMHAAKLLDETAHL